MPVVAASRWGARHTELAAFAKSLTVASLQMTFTHDDLRVIVTFDNF